MSQQLLDEIHALQEGWTSARDERRLAEVFLGVHGMELTELKNAVNRRDDQVSLYAQDLTLPDITEGPRGPVVVSMALARATNGLAHRMKGVLQEHPGATEVHVKLTQPGRSVLMRLDDSLRVTASPALFGDLKALLGPACLS